MRDFKFGQTFVDLGLCGASLSRHVGSDVGPLVRLLAGFNMQVLTNVVQKYWAPDVGVSHFYTEGLSGGVK